jgi:Ran-binding protein 3
VPDKNAGSGVNTDSGATTEAPPQPVETSDKAEGTKVEFGGDKVVAGEPNEGSCMPSEVQGKTKDGDAKEKEGADELIPLLDVLANKLKNYMQCRTLTDIC